MKKLILIILFILILVTPVYATNLGDVYSTSIQEQWYNSLGVDIWKPYYELKNIEYRI